MHAHPISIPPRTKVLCTRTLKLRGQILSPYFSSTPVCTPCSKLKQFLISHIFCCLIYLISSFLQCLSSFQYCDVPSLPFLLFSNCNINYHIRQLSRQLYWFYIYTNITEQTTSGSNSITTKEVWKFPLKDPSDLPLTQWVSASTEVQVGGLQWLRRPSYFWQGHPSSYKNLRSYIILL